MSHFWVVVTALFELPAGVPFFILLIFEQLVPRVIFNVINSDSVILNRKIHLVLAKTDWGNWHFFTKFL
jgi:hypothetical protein